MKKLVCFSFLFHELVERYGNRCRKPGQEARERAMIDHLRVWSKPITKRHNKDPLIVSQIQISSEVTLTVTQSFTRHIEHKRTNTCLSMRDSINKTVSRGGRFGKSPIQLVYSDR